MKNKKVKMNTKEDMSDALMSKFAIKNENEVKDIVKNNVLFDKEELGIWSEFALEGLKKDNKELY